MHRIFKNVVKTLLLGLILACSAQVAGHAQATRTWVSGLGDDANPCSRTAPCKTFAGAMSKTAASGEIDVLDPGGFGTLTITKSITIDGGAGQVASVLASNSNGITISAPTGTAVTAILRNLSINGIGAPGQFISAPGSNGINGVSMNYGSQLTMENCKIFGFATAVNLFPSGVNPGGGTTNMGLVSLKNVSIQNCQAGIVAGGGATDISHSSITQIANIGAQALAGTISILSCSLTGNGTAVQSSPGAIIRLSNNDMFNNGTAIVTNGGTVSTAGNNHKAGNANPGDVPTTAITTI